MTIVAIGKMVAKANNIAKELEKDNIRAEVINARFLKPFDKETMLSSIHKTKNVVTIEDNSINGGLASKVKEMIVENKLEGVKMQSYAYPDKFIEHGKVNELEEIYGLQEENIIKDILRGRDG